MSRRGTVLGYACRPAKNAQRQNLLDDPNGLTAAFDPIIRLPVIGQALLVQSTKTGLVPEEWPVSHQYTPLQKAFDGAIQPNEGDAGSINIAKEGSVPWLGKRAASECEHHSRVAFRCPPKHAREAFVFDVAENRFALFR